MRVVKILSPEYFELLKKDTTFAKAQQLGWALSINVGAERIVVEKDGKQKDETLIPKVEPQVPGPGKLNQQQFRNFEQNQQQFRNLQVPPNGGLNQKQKQLPKVQQPNQNQ